MTFSLAIQLIFAVLLLNVLQTESILGINVNLPIISTSPCAAPPKNFPSGIAITKTNFQNWNEKIVANNLWKATPSSIVDVIALANWAAANNYKVRPLGTAFSWSPVTVTPNSPCTSVILVDLSKYFTSISLVDSDPNLNTSAVRVQTGALMRSLLDFLENMNRGLLHTPEVGNETVGGAFALGTHGLSVPAAGETTPPGMTYGSLSNTIISLTAIVWDNSTRQYVAKEFLRKDAETSAFLTHVGRALIIDYVIRVGANYNLRCVTRTDKPYAELFSSPGNATTGISTYSDHLNAFGTTQALFFPFSAVPQNTFLRYCSVTPVKPAESREVTSPYNYPYFDAYPAPAADLVRTLSDVTQQQLTPGVETATMLLITAAIPATQTGDIWGLSKNHLLFIKSTTLHVTTSGYAVLTSRNNVQRVTHDFASFYTSLLKTYSDNFEYPMNGPFETRIAGVDNPEDVLVPGAGSPSIAASAPYSLKPEFDTVLWYDLTTFPNSPKLFEFMEKVESFLFSRFNGQDALVRPEWSKQFGFTKAGPYTNQTIIKTLIPQSYGSGWNWANAVLQAYDPYSIYTNDYLDMLFN